MSKPSLVKFKSMPNFRLLTETTNEGEFNHDGLPLLYRSSRPDFVTGVDIAQFKRIGIKTIIDFRSAKEYSKATGDKLLDKYYPVFKVKVNIFGKPEMGNPKSELIKRHTYEEKPLGKHYLIDFFKMNYIFAVYNRAPHWFKLYSLFYLIYDLIFNTGYRNFVKVFAEKVLNKSGLAGQYIDMLNHSQAAIISALKLLNDPRNLPAVINCAHGKDRTGIVSALVLGCLGKSKEYIAENYAMSEMELLPIKDRVQHEICGKYHMDKSFTTARKETMMHVMNHIDQRYGSISGYLELIGFTAAEQSQLRRNLIAVS